MQRYWYIFYYRGLSHERQDHFELMIHTNITAITYLYKFSIKIK